MAGAKDIKIKVIPSKIANDFIREHHYSGKVVNNSTLHFGAFLNRTLHGVMSFGSPLDKRKVLGLVVDKNGEPCKWNEMLELNRMAFDDTLPKNSESRAISIAFRLLKRNAPHIKWILSFADGTQCGDGTIYRASGFRLTLIKKNTDCMITKKGVVHTMTVKSSKTLMNKYGNWKDAMKGEYGDFTPLVGYQLRYIKILDNDYKLNCEDIPFSKIAEEGARMYKGKRYASIVK